MDPVVKPRGDGEDERVAHHAISLISHSTYDYLPLMRTIPTRQRVTLARRIAAGLPVWAAAKGSNLPAADVGELMGEPEFRDLIGAWSEIFDLSPEARGERLVRLAHMVVERRIAMDCGRTAHFILREARRRRDPVARLAKGFSQLVDMEKHRAERFGAGPVDSPPPPAEPSALSPVAEAEAAERIRPRPHADDAMLWRRAGSLRQDMLGEQVLFGAVAEHAAAVKRGTFLEIEEVAAIEAAQVASYEARLAEAREAEVEEAKAREAAEAGQAEAQSAEPRRIGPPPFKIPPPQSDVEAADILLKLATECPDYLTQMLDRWEARHGPVASQPASGRKTPQAP